MAKAPTKAQQAAAAKAAAKAGATAAPAATAAAQAAAPFGAVANAGINLAALSALVAATNDPARTFCFMTLADVQPLEAAGYAETKADMTGPDANGAEGVASRATPAGMAYLAQQTAAAPAAPVFAAPAAAPVAQTFAAPAAPAAGVPVSPAPTAFKIVANVPIPAAKRFGKSTVYPFDALQVGQGFFVPATTERPNPAKSMASTVNSAKNRYAVIQGKMADGVTDNYVLTREFVLRNVPDGKDFGPEFAGVKGAGIWRTA